MNDFTRTNIKIFGNSKKEMAHKSTNGNRRWMCSSSQDLFYYLNRRSMGRDIQYTHKFCIALCINSFLF